MRVKVSKTDKRHTGHALFNYVVNIELDHTTLGGFDKRRAQQMLDLNEVRDWCHITWGPSCERMFYLKVLQHAPDHVLNTHWCWETEFNNFKIYLKTDKEANWFKLKWL